MRYIEITLLAIIITLSISLIYVEMEYIDMTTDYGYAMELLDMFMSSEKGEIVREAIYKHDTNRV